MIRLSRRKLSTYLARAAEKGDLSVAVPQVAAYLVESSRTKEAELIVMDVERFLEGHGRVVASVASAHALDQNELDQIEQMLKRRYDAREVDLVSEVEEELLGGVVVRTASEEFDGSLKRSIKRLRALGKR